MHSIESGFVTDQENVVCRHEHLLFSPGHLQAGAVKGLTLNT